MAKKKIVRAENITEKDILSFYESVLPLLIHNPENIHPANRLKRRLEKFIPYDFGYYTMETPEMPLDGDRRFLIFEEDPLNHKKGFSTLLTVPTKSKNKKRTFDDMIEHAYNKAIKDEEDFYKQKLRPFHYYHMISPAYPKLATGFFRYKDGANGFSESEISTFEFLGPHIFLLLRTIVNDALRAPSLKYFTILNNISQALAKKYALTDNEYKLIPEILFGLTNEEIAGKYFVTVSTIKKHFTHLFKKTHSKNRVDFISKFFTSPEPVDL